MEYTYTTETNDGLTFTHIGPSVEFLQMWRAIDIDAGHKVTEIEPALPDSHFGVN